MRSFLGRTLKRSLYLLLPFLILLFPISFEKNSHFSSYSFTCFGAAASWLVALVFVAKQLAGAEPTATGRPAGCVNEGRWWWWRIHLSWPLHSVPFLLLLLLLHFFSIPVFIYLFFDLLHHFYCLSPFCNSMSALQMWTDARPSLPPWLRITISCSFLFDFCVNRGGGEFQESGHWQTLARRRDSHGQESQQ